MAFGGLVALSVGAVLVLSVRANYVNTRSLLDLNAISMIDDLEQRIVAQSRQNEDVVRSLAKLYEEGYIGKDDSPPRRAAIEALVSTASDISGIAVEFENGVDTAYFRDRGFLPFPQDVLNAVSNSEPIGPVQEDKPSNDVSGVEKAPAPWQAPIFIGSELYLNVSTALGDEGTAYVFVRQDVVSNLISRIAPPNGAVVFLLSQDGYVISNSAMPEVFRRGEFPPLSEFPDPALRDYANSRENEGSQELKEKNIRLSDTPGYSDGYIYVTKNLFGHWARPLTLGVYFRKVDVGDEILRVIYVMLAGIVGLILAVVAAAFLGRRISRPLVRAARSASLLSEMQFDEIKTLPRSRIREIDRQASALNNMYTTVLQFTRYVPRELVERLMRSGEIANKPVERDVTILFTDIVGFTPISEKMSATEIARLLNRHFEILTGNISASDGTVDKFMGDGAMAFWGAPVDDPDQILNALTAVKNIIQNLETDNAEKKARGEPILRLRLGLHSGPVVVGNIGGEARQNYTIVGDTVNVAQRLEQLGKEYMSEDQQAVVLVSSTIAEAAASNFTFTPVGEHKIRGREGSVGICLLQTKPG